MHSPRERHMTTLRRRATDAVGQTPSSSTRCQVLPARAEIAIRRVKWWQAMTKHNHAHWQTMAAIWRQLTDGSQTLTSEGVLAHTEQTLSQWLSLRSSPVCGTVRHGGLLRTVGGKTIFCGVHFRRRRRQRLLPAHRLQTHANSSILQSNTLGHT